MEGRTDGLTELGLKLFHFLPAAAAREESDLSAAAAATAALLSFKAYNNNDGKIEWVLHLGPFRQSISRHCFEKNRSSPIFFFRGTNRLLRITLVSDFSPS